MESYFIKMDPVLSAALAVCAGVYGVDPERTKKLKADGYDPAKVQALVNKLFPIIKGMI